MPGVPKRLPDLALVGIGGTFGTAARAALVLSVPDIDALPTTIGGINLVGAALLGVLVGVLTSAACTTASESRDAAALEQRRRARLLLGTGVLGGFTTYSALSVDVVALLNDRAAAGVAYALISLIAGIASAACGLLAGRAVGGRLGGRG